MMSDAQFELMTSLQYTNKDLKRRLREFETGEKYVSMKAAHKTDIPFRMDTQSAKCLTVIPLKSDSASARI